MLKSDIESNGDKEPMCWFKSTSQENYLVSVSEEIFFSGTKSAVIRSLVDKPEGMGMISQSIDATAYLGKRLRFYALVKSLKLSSAAGLTATMYADDHTTVGMQFCKISENTDWFGYEIVFDVPVGAIVLNCSIHLKGTGTIWIDNVKLEEVEPEIGLTPHSDKPQKINSDPTNLSFASGTKDYIDKSGLLWNIPSEWIIEAGDKVRFSILNSEKRDESKAVLIESDAEDSECSFLQYINASRFIGMQAKLSAQIKTRKTNFSSLLMTAYSSDDRIIRICASDENSRVEPTTDWKNFECTLPILPETDYFSIGLMAMGLGKIWLKDIKLIEEPFDKEADEKRFEDPEINLQNSEPTNFNLQNSSIDSGSAVSLVPAGWIGQPGKGYKIVSDSTETIDDSNAVLIESLVDKPSKYSHAVLSQHICPQKYLGKRLRFSAEVKTHNADWAALWMRARREGRYVYTLGFKSLHANVIEGTTDWSTKNCVVDIPNDCVNISFGIVLYGKGKCWLAKPSLEEVSLEVPTNDLKVTVPEKKNLENIDFEGN